MPRCERILRIVLAAAGALLVVEPTAPGVLRREARADRPPVEMSIASPPTPERQPFPRRGASGSRAGSRAEGSGTWWLGTAGIALALALCGGVSVAARRYLPQNSTGPLRVVGRTSLSPKHTVYLLKAGDRVLIVGAGPQGAPSLLGELADPPAAGFDRRVGDHT